MLSGLGGQKAFRLILPEPDRTGLVINVDRNRSSGIVGNRPQLKNRTHVTVSFFPGQGEPIVSRNRLDDPVSHVTYIRERLESRFFQGSAILPEPAYEAAKSFVLNRRDDHSGRLAGKDRLGNPS